MNMRLEAQQTCTLKSEAQPSGHKLCREKPSPNAEQLTIDEMVLRAIDKYKDHPSIRVINQPVTLNGNTFNFSHVSPTEVMKQIDLLDNNKSRSGNIPTGILKATREKVGHYLTDCIHSAIYDCKFPDELKDADLSPLLKNDERTLKENFRPINV